jgi:HEAT repeat protein
MWFCARCGHAKPSPLSECATCASAETVTSAAAAAPKRCPKCGGDVPGPSSLGRLTCPACRNDFGDYAEWLAQCRAAAYAAHPAPSHAPPFEPGPPPVHLRKVAIGFLAAAPLQVLGGLLAPDVLLPCLLLAALQLAAGGILLKGLRGADGLARLAAGLSVLLPVPYVTAFFFMWVFHYFCRPEVASHYGPPTASASPTARARVLLALFFLAIAGLLTQAFLVTPALRTALAWQEPLSGPLAAAHDVLQFYWRHSDWIILGGVGGFWVLGLLGGLRRRLFFPCAGLAAAALFLLGPALAVPSILFRREAAKAEALGLESDLNTLLWALKEPDPKMRLASARRIEALGRDARTAVPALEKALEDVDARVRTAAALALSVLKPQSDRAVAALIDALAQARSPLWEVDALTSALLRFGPRARPALRTLLADLPKSSSGVALLAEIGAPALPGLLEMLGHPAPDARRRALEVLRRIGPDARGVATAVEAAMKDPDVQTAAEAVRAFGEIQREKALPALYELICGDSPLKPAAAEALCALGERDGLAGQPRPGNHLNAVRRPAQWDHLRRAAVDHDVDGTKGEILEELATRAVMCVESSPDVERDLLPFQRFYASARKRSILDLLQALDLPFVLEEDRIRILAPARAKDFWTQWTFEALAGRP